MCRFDQSVTDQIAIECMELFKKLPKSGKPIDEEWTVLSSVIQYDTVTNNSKVVSLGTGSKCIGATKMSPLGNILNDSHAEIIARRGFLLYLYDNIEQCLQDKDSIFISDDSLCKLKSNIDFVFYSSQLPCGDASIIPKENQIDDLIGDTVCSIKRSLKENLSNECKRSKLHDIHRTGAKCLQNSEQDPKLPGTGYHILGQVRTKPGRGDRTLSVSCSDKIARWIHLGIQGSLLDMLLSEPIFIKHFIFSAGVAFSSQSLNRALFNRSQDRENHEKLSFVPYIYESSVQFSHIRTKVNKRPAPSSIIWVNMNNGIFEAAVQGKKIGVTKKNEKLSSNYLSISKFNLYKRFQSVLNKNKVWKERLCGSDELTKIPYNEMKSRSKRYIQNWNEIKESFFKIWTKKPDIFNFRVV